jgi:tRNA-dihydrouridine synthase A
LDQVDGVMIGRSAYENPFMLKDVENRIFDEISHIDSKKEVLNKYLDYVEIKVNEGHNLPKMLKHLFGLSRGDKNAKIFRLKIIEAMKENTIEPFRDDLNNLLVY